MVVAVYSPVHRRHAPTHEVNLGEPIPANEQPGRIERIREVLLADARFAIVEPTEHGVVPIEAVHDPGLVRFLETAWPALHDRYGRDEFFPEVVYHGALRAGMGPASAPTDAEQAFGYWCFETATPLVEGSYAAARASVDVALSTADVVTGGEPIAYGLCRPPGHHAATSVFGGFCFFNNAAIVAARLVAEGSRVTILDVDYHHGNGTQQIFYDSDAVQFVSLHGDPVRAYPWFTGFADETGAGAGLGHTVNLPLAAGTTDDEYVLVLGAALERIAQFRPDVLVVSLGVDTFWNDPISDLALTAEGYRRCGRLIAELALPTVVLQEGGYDIEAIGSNVHAWLTGLLA
jgi:acetoin utilization deacetylase AcuC-like enzyme